MLQSLLSYLQIHGLTAVVAVFVCLSAVMTAVASLLQALGAKVPGIVGTLIDWSGKVVHLLNGNTSALK